MTTQPLQTLPMRAATTNTPPAFTMPPGACDTHFHVFEDGFPHVDAPLYTFPDGRVEQYAELAAHLGFHRMVLVQPTFYGDDNTLLLDALDRLGPRARGVVRVGEGVTDRHLDDWHERGVRAIRLDLFARADWPLEDLRSYVMAQAERVRERGWHLQFYAPGAVVRALIPYLAPLDVPYVIDHMGYMKRADGFGEADFEALTGLLDTGNCWIKLSGPYRVAGSAPLSSVAPLGRALVAARADRLVWGSDWPHLPDGQRDTGEVLNLLRDWAPDEGDRRTILTDGPTRLFFS
ncbi:amidohydrolase family protein [Streptomyces sp. NPDC093252]|uniref:amidohydrolase family protein n=1 Tax=Streptomyces sp. NPDC093252 TaxID=3154980 RepID=UPI00343B7940